MSIKRQLSLALLVGVGSSLIGCKTPMGSGVAFWNRDDSSVASSAPDAPKQKYESLAKEFGGSTSPQVALGGQPPASTDGPVVSSWNKTTAAVAAAFTPKPKIETDDPTSLSSKNGKMGPGVYVGLGRVYESQNKPAEAIAAYDKALSLAPSDLSAMVSLARLHDRQGNSAKAIELYQKALKSHTKSALVHNDLGLCYARQKQWQRATDSLNKAIELQPGNPKYRNNLATVMVEQGRTDEAFKQLAQVNSEAVAHYNLAYLLQQKGQNGPAVLHLQQAIARDTSLTPAQEMLAQLTGQAAPAYAPQPESRLAAQPVATPIYRQPSDLQWQPQASPALEPHAAQSPPAGVSAQANGSGGTYHIGDEIGPIPANQAADRNAWGFGSDSAASTGVEPLPPIEG